MEEEQERVFDGEQGHGKQDVGGRLDLQTPQKELNERRRDDRGARVDVLLYEEIRDIDVERGGARYQGNDGEEEEAVVNGDSVGENDANVSSANS